MSIWSCATGVAMFHVDLHFSLKKHADEFFNGHDFTISCEDSYKINDRFYVHFELNLRQNGDEAAKIIDRWVKSFPPDVAYDFKFSTRYFKTVS